MTNLDVDGLTFTFPDRWRASKFDEWSFYRNQFSRQRSGIKAVDVVAISPAKQAFLIEVKDYRHPEAVKPSGLAEAIASKTMDTLAAMLPAKLLASEAEERIIAANFLKCTSLEVVVHIEQPLKRMPMVDVADIQQKLKQLLRAVDKKPKIVSVRDMRGLEWRVR